MPLKTTKTSNRTLIEGESRVVVEPGPKRLKAVATPELLDDAITANHYRAPVEQPVYVNSPFVERDGKRYYIADLVGNFKPGAPLLKDGKPVTALFYTIDSLNKPIVLGEEMDYIDWKNPDRQWNVYQEYPDDEGIRRFHVIAIYSTEVEAVVAASELAGKPEPAKKEETR